MLSPAAQTTRRETERAGRCDNGSPLASAASVFIHTFSGFENAGSKTGGVIQRAYKYRFYPTTEQVAMLERCFGHCRWVWNHALDRRSKAYRRRKESISGVDVSRALSQLKRLDRYAWLRDVPATVITQRLRDQDRAFTNFFAGRARYPRFRKRRAGSHESVRFQLDQRQVHRTWNPAEKHLALPRLGTLRLRWSHVPAGVPKMVTVRRDPAGRWFVTMAVEEPARAVPAPTNEVVGIDVGLSSLLVRSDGKRVPNPQHLKKRLKQLRHANRALSRRQRGSGRWHRARARVGRLQTRIADARADLLHQTTSSLIHESQVIGVEDLAVSNMIRNRRLARAIGDAGWGELRRQLEYKADWSGRTVHVVDRFYPSSKTCSCCGHRIKALNLSVRHWRCPACEAEHDRDVNAAVNLERAARSAVLARGGSLTPPSRTQVRSAVAVDETRIVQPLLTAVGPVGSRG